MKLTRIQPLTVTGLSVRTNNAREMTPEGRIGPLWQRFSENIAPQLKNGSQVYGAYCNYECNAQGGFDFDVIAGTDQPGLTKPEGLTSVALADATYLVFPAEGQLPQAVIDAWQRIWAYFEQPDCPHERAFTTDFELYVNEAKSDIHIAVK